MKTIIIFFLPIILLGIVSCDTNEPPPPPSNGENPQLELKLEDASCTEAWIELTTTNLQLPATLTLKQFNPTGDTLSQILNLNTQDSVLYIDSLMPKQTYQYQASSIEYQVSSNELSVTTMDTTSHDFTWQVFTFGEHSHSRLNDIAIVGNEIWAVGEIYLNDSIGQSDPTLYNLVKWDGINWSIIRVPYYYQGYPYYHPIQSIFAFGQDDIWFCGNGVIHWDGNYFIPIPIPTEVWGPYQMNKIWGSSNNDLYVMGNEGNNAHYQNGSWSRIESGTEVDLFDIWGNNDGPIWTCGYSDDYGISALLRYTGGEWETVYEGNSASQSNGFYIGPISGVWSANNFRIYMMNWGGIYIQKNSNEFFLEKEIADFSDVGFGIDGTDDNNIFACGEGFVGHWNGVSYIEYPELYRVQRTFYSVSVKGNTVCAVGSDYKGFIYSQAVIALSK
jgi:hypothetical protein